jgi:hypothetical protein
MILQLHILVVWSMLLCRDGISAEAHGSGEHAPENQQIGIVCLIIHEFTSRR